jgi:ribonuclease P protein component
MPARLVNKADFERLLGARPWARSMHFAVHHVAAAPSRPIRLLKGAEAEDLSTGAAPACPPLVDDQPATCWLGCVVPKRHARRAVTRNLLKRQVRGAFERHEPALPYGLWLVRLRQGFAVSEFPSARSSALQHAARLELDALFTRGVR